MVHAPSRRRSGQDSVGCIPYRVDDVCGMTERTAQHDTSAECGTCGYAKQDCGRLASGFVHTVGQARYPIGDTGRQSCVDAAVDSTPCLFIGVCARGS